MISDLEKQWADYDESFGGGNDRVTEAYTCDWDKRIACRSDLLGSGGYPHPDHTWLRCHSIRIRAVGDPDTSDGGPSTAMLVAEYAPQSYTSLENTNNVMSDWREHWEGSGEAITIGKGYRWSDAATFATCTPIQAEDDVSAVKIFPSATITMTGKTDRVTTTTKEYILDLIGRVNIATKTIKDKSYAAQKLLFLGADINEEGDSEGNTRHQIAFKFAARHKCTWNEFWNPNKSGGPDFMKMVDESGAVPYLTGVFSDLDPKNW